MLIGKTQITFPLVRFALKRAIMLHSVTSYKLIVASVVRKTGEPWGTTGMVVQERNSKYQNTKPTPY
jgi:CRISPR/Cas system-associated endonuclease Cas1